jgi:3-methyl-2-oxobutanoate hydroxymethyltransferase
VTDNSSPVESGRLGAAVRRIRVTDFYNAKRQHERWAMLTSYDQYTAELFDEAGLWALLVGDHWSAPW